MDREEIRELALSLYDLLKREDLEKVVEYLLERLKEEGTERLRMVKTPILNSIGRKIGKLIAKEDWRFARLLKLWKFSLVGAERIEYGVTSGREVRYIVINALGELSKRDYEATKDFILKILDDLRDWEMVDTIALRVLVNLVKQNREEMFSILEEWVYSENKWVRRLAMATVPPLIRAKPEIAETCLKLIEKLMDERDRDVKKAVAWALREISKKNPEAVYNFLQRYIGNSDVNTKWIIKEGSKKLPREWRERLYS